MFEEVKKRVVEIVPMGSYAELDAEGYIVNPTNLDKLQDDWKPVIAATLDFYKATFGGDLHSFFVRGSVAKGEAVNGISDLDTFAYINDLGDRTFTGLDRFFDDMRLQFPFCEGIELQCKAIEQIEKDGSLLVASLQMYGVSVSVPKLKPGRDMIRNAGGIFPRMRRSADRIDTLRLDPHNKRAMDECVWLMKEILRVGVELTYERSGRYTRDLYLCQKDFEEYYPEYADIMMQALYLALNPIDNLEEIVRIRDMLVPFLKNEAVTLGIAEAPISVSIEQPTP